MTGSICWLDDFNTEACKYLPPDISNKKNRETGDIVIDEGSEREGRGNGAQADESER